ncbi:MAG TPA: 16S rRNA (uracil(1498)-N(3))-methyltransferase [Steroidobacteraceae bacterium]|jgi:16S rRNA (uracil1498-N3)-methyltransferase|nr:16S rRNA (uracil(1498)-N(3))-methyltransferase [Steroidobacteraceae bacterium]
MRLTRVYVEAALTSGSVVELPRETGSHLAKVLRARSGDELILFNGDGREFGGSIEEVRGSRISAFVGDARPVDRESPLAITLVQCVPRGDRMDFIVQKATELGVARIVPVLSQRSVVRLDAAQAQSKANHWRAVTVSACEQCGRNRLPVIETVQPLLNYLGRSVPGAGPRLVFEPESAPQPHCAADQGPPAAALNGGWAKLAVADAQVAIGPEGGFTSDELEAFRVCGYSQGGLGPRVLRTETAAIAAVVWLQARFGDM